MMGNSVREKILETAARLFAQRGYELVGINEIISTAQVARASFYNHFKSKELLCLAWLETEMASSQEANGQLLKKYPSAEERIREKFSKLKSHLEESHYRGCPFSNTRSMVSESASIGNLIKDYKTTSREFWKKIATDAHCSEEIGESLFLLYSGATTESQNLSELSPVDCALNTSLSLIK